MGSLYFRDPLGHLFDPEYYKFEPPQGYTHIDVLAEAHRIRVAREAHNIEYCDFADALIALARKSRHSMLPHRAGNVEVNGYARHAFCRGS